MPIAGLLRAIEPADIATVSGIVAGALAATEANDVAVITGKADTLGALVGLEAYDVVTIVGSAPPTGRLTSTEASDISVLSGVAPPYGQLVVLEAADGAAGTGDIVISEGTLAASENNDAAHLGLFAHLPPASTTTDQYGRPLRSIPYDVHVRRSGDDYATQFIGLLPRGQAWPTDPDSTLYRACRGLANYYGFVDSRAADLLERECDPRFTIELLPDWERAWGLPDPCFPEATTIGERQRMLVLVMTMLGGQSRAWFQWVADWIGFPIHFREWAPFMAGVSEVGETRYEYDNSGYYRWEIGPPEMRFYWSVQPAAASVTWFRAASGQAGVDPHVRIGTAEDLACLFRRWKPAHTDIVFNYESLAAGGPMQGTP